jgi:hypothetical protein
MRRLASSLPALRRALQQPPKHHQPHPRLVVVGCLSRNGRTLTTQQPQQQPQAPSSPPPTPPPGAGAGAGGPSGAGAGGAAGGGPRPVPPRKGPKVVRCSRCVRRCCSIVPACSRWLAPWLNQIDRSIEIRSDPCTVYVYIYTHHSIPVSYGTPSTHTHDTARDVDEPGPDGGDRGRVGVLLPGGERAEAAGRLVLFVCAWAADVTAWSVLCAGWLVR